MALFYFASNVPEMAIQPEPLEVLRFDICFCLCYNCKTLQKRRYVKINPNNRSKFVCTRACQELRLDEIPDVISVLDDAEKRSLRMVKLCGQFRGPNWHDYQRYLGRAHLSVN